MHVKPFRWIAEDWGGTVDPWNVEADVGQPGVHVATLLVRLVAGGGGKGEENNRSCGSKADDVAHGEVFIPLKKWGRTILPLQSGQHFDG